MPESAVVAEKDAIDHRVVDSPTEVEGEGITKDWESEEAGVRRK